VAIAGGGSDLLGMMKERLVTPDVLVSLKAIKGLDQAKAAAGGGMTIGGLITLDALAHTAAVRDRYAVLAEAAESVATPQIRTSPRSPATSASVPGAGTTATGSSA
jgi:Aerobic-type carbon monoxide dehydrogenase, middle subunit CoxM/CutM homologs